MKRYQYGRSGSSPSTSTCTECPSSGTASWVPSRTTRAKPSSAATSQRTATGSAARPASRIPSSDSRVHSTTPPASGSPDATPDGKDGTANRAVRSPAQAPSDPTATRPARSRPTRTKSRRERRARRSGRTSALPSSSRSSPGTWVDPRSPERRPSLLWNHRSGNPKRTPRAHFTAWERMRDALRTAVTALALAGFATGWVAALAAQRSDLATLCAPGARGARLAGGSASPAGRTPTDLFCFDLHATAAGREAWGVVELGRVPGPFGVTVTARGNHVSNLTAWITGLPDPAEFGTYASYVAWATTPTLDPVIRLGPVANGRNPLGRVSLNKFLILVTAEASTDAAERRGRLVLRGRSPSTLMEAHDLLAQAPEALRTPEGMSHDHAGGMEGSTWNPPPMYPGLPMLPGIMALRPRVDPYLPQAPAPESLPPVRPRQLVLWATAGRSTSRPGSCAATSAAARWPCWPSTDSSRPPRPSARRRHHLRQLHQPHAVADRHPLARHPPRQPLRRGPRRHPGPRGARRDLPLPDPFPGRRHLLVPSPSPRGHPAGDGPVQETCWWILPTPTTTDRSTGRRC